MGSVRRKVEKGKYWKSMEVWKSKRSRRGKVGDFRGDKGKLGGCKEKAGKSGGVANERVL